MKNSLNNKLHIKELEMKISALKQQCAAQGTVGSGSYLFKLCELLLDDVDKYYSDLHHSIFNLI